jgi:hypothetical protein
VRPGTEIDDHFIDEGYMVLPLNPTGSA